MLSPANNLELQTEQCKLNQKSLSLTPDVSTRWNSFMQMIQRLVKNQTSVSAVFEDPHHKHNLFLQNESEWEKPWTMETFFEPYCHATEILGGKFLVQLFFQRYAILFVPWPWFVVRFKKAFIDVYCQRRKHCNLSWYWISSIAMALDLGFNHPKCLPNEKIYGYMDIRIELKELMKTIETQKTPSSPNKIFRFVCLSNWKWTMYHKNYIMNENDFWCKYEAFWKIN